MLQMPFDILLVARYVGAAVVLGIIVMVPAYLARQTKKSSLDMVKIRCASWLLGWTGVGWLWALWWAVRK